MSKKSFFSAVAAGVIAFGSGAFGVTAMAADATGTAAHGNQHVVMQASTNPASLELHFSGAQRISFYDAGTLQITRSDGTSWKYRPNLSQDVNGKRKYLVPDVRIIGKDRVAVSVTKIDESAPVLLDGKSPNS
jgi:hypothetical protein